MKRVLLILSVLGLCVVQTSGAAIISNSTMTKAYTANSNSYGSTQNIYSTNNGGVHISSSESILKALRPQKIKQEEDKIFRELIIQRSQNEYEIVQRNENKYERKQELAKKPNIKTGMTKSKVMEQVIYNANWGIPNSVTVTFSMGNRETWLYGDKRYLEFNNDKLTKIKE